MGPVTRLALAVALFGCASDAVVIVPVIDSPPPTNTRADPFPNLTTITLSIALAGDPDDLVPLTTFLRGDQLELRDVPYGENLVIHMVGYVGPTEVAVGRTCPFSVRFDEPPPRPHLYFARSFQFVETEAPQARIGGAAITYHDGSALFLGGFDGTATTSAVTSVDRFDPMTGSFEIATTARPAMSLVARRGGRVATLADGRVVVAGGTDPVTAIAVPIIEVLTADAISGRRVEELPAGLLTTRVAPAFATLDDGTVVAFGGLDATGRVIGDVALISIVDGAIQVASSSATLKTPRFGHTATRLTDDLVLIAGGIDGKAGGISGEIVGGGVLVAKAEIYKNDGFVEAGDMKVPRRDHQAMLLSDGSVLIVGGVDSRGRPVRTIEVFSLGAGFVADGEVKPLLGTSEVSATTLPDGRVLFAGGRDKDGLLVRDAFIARPEGLFETPPLVVPRAGHQATLLCDGTVMVVGGSVSATTERLSPGTAGRR